MDLLQQTLKFLGLFALAPVDLFDDVVDVLGVLGDSKLLQLVQSLLLVFHTLKGV